MILVLITILGVICTVVATGIAVVDFVERKHVPRGVIATVIAVSIIAALVLTFVTQQTSASSSSTPSEQAQAIISQYYDDINNHTYRDAYNLLGSVMRQQQSYNNFSNGFQSTLIDTITINNIAPQSDGTVIVSLTLKATEHANSGTGLQVNTYQGTYIVGLQNGAWKILSGYLQTTV